MEGKIILTYFYKLIFETGFLGIHIKFEGYHHSTNTNGDDALILGAEDCPLKSAKKESSVGFTGLMISQNSEKWEYRRSWGGSISSESIFLGE
jgi:hypothetical protein